ncbi:MAG: glycosyltransferase family 4 protein [Clostridiales bacterium]|nr:glycosyltransferase family 4 protein [Clostridiales bacterium]
MKILYLCTFYHIALLYSQQKEALCRRNISVKVFNSAKYGAGVADKFVPAVSDQDVVHEECWKKLDRVFFFPRQWKIEKRLKKAYDLSDFDLMHAHLLVSSGYTARRMKKKYGLKYVLSVRVTDLIGFIRLPFFHGLAIRNADQASGLLFLSKCHKEEFMSKYVPAKKREAFEAKSVVIGNPLEKFWEEHTSSPRTLESDKKVRILLVGRINKVKNIPVAAEAAGILRNKGIDATLTVVGEVEDKEEEAKLRQYDFVKQLPFMGHEDLIKVYQDSDIFLLPSKVETFGRVYTEAMSQGLPVLYSKGQGFDEVYKDGEVGFSVPCDDPEYIADRIEVIMREYGRISENCIRNVADFYENSIMNKLEEFYRSSIGRV